ncbi:amino acid adenylation domain-containing protein [Streptomyces sp. NPDC006645]|uniref:amino acid adenylation domain-containing protein n=1 Tax=unclassified Streptomyces TaxID=2593676 RepID=UPI0033A9A065
MFIDLPSAVREHAAARGTKPALTFLPGALSTTRTDLTFAEVDRRARAVAGLLRQRVRPGDRALLIMPTAAEFVPAFLGCLAAGVVVVPLPMPVDESSVRRVLNVARDCEPALVLSLSPLTQHLAQLPELAGLRDGVPWIDIDLIDQAAGDDAPDHPLSPDSLAFLQYTSGSTKAPRGVMVTHGALMDNETAIRRSFRVTPDDTVVSWLPLHHDMGLIGALLQPLCTGARSVILDPLTFLRRPAVWLETISEERAGISGGPNFAYELCLRKVTDEERARLDLSCWKLAFNGAAPVAPRTLRAFSETFGEVGFRPTTHTPCYGLAEVTLLVASTDAVEECASRTYEVSALEQGHATVVADAGGDVDGGRELIAYGLLDHAAVRIVDPATRAPLPDGRIGEIWVAGESAGAGYWGDAEASEATFRAELAEAEAADGAGTAGEAESDRRSYVRTGDLGFLHEGSLQVTGRMKDLVIYRGRNLHPEDLEVDVAAADPAFRPGCGAVFSLPADAAGEEAVVVVQEVRAGTPEEDHPALAGRIRQVLSREYGVTARTVALLPQGAIAKTSSGKVQRHLARQRFLAKELPMLWSRTVTGADSRGVRDGLPGGRSALEAPEAERPALLTLALCERLEQLTGTPAEPGTAPTSLGMDSLMATRVLQELEDLLGVRLRQTLVLRAESVAALAEAALTEAARAGTTPAAGPQEDTEPHKDAGPDSGSGTYELTHAQRALWFLQRSDPASYAYNVTRAFLLTGDLDTDRLTAALRSVVRRNPALRLMLRSAGGVPEASVARDRELRVESVDARGRDDRWVQDRADELATRPFDLERDELVRATVLHRDEDTVLVLSLHHVVCDLTSLTVVLDQLKEAYDDRADWPETEPGRPSPAALEESALQSRGDELLTFWKERLAGELPVLELPGSTRRRGPEGATVSFDGSPELLAALRRLSRDRGTTLHNLLLASFQVLLHRITGQSDLVVGVPVNSRTRTDLVDQVGYLVNVLPVRSAFATGTPLAEFATETHHGMLDALDHQDMPFALLTRHLNPDRAGGAPPVFQAMFSHYTTTQPGDRGAVGVVLGDPDAVLALDGATVRAHPVPERTTQSDIGLNVAEFTDSLLFGLSYDTALLPRAQAVRLLSAYQALLTAAVAAPDVDVALLPLVDEEGAKDLLALSAGPVIPREEHYVATVERQVARTPDAEAVDDGTERLTYAELDARANRVARRLRAAGAGPETNVVLCAERSASFLAVLLGIHKTGACYVPIGTREAPRRIADMLRTLRAVAVVADARGQALMEGLPEAGGDSEPLPVLDLDTVCAGPGEAGSSAPSVPSAPSTPAPSVSPVSAAYIIHTSGSTGVPKAATVTAAGLTNHLWQMIEHFSVTAQDVVGQTAPATFDISLWQFLAPLMVGGRLRVLDDRQALSPARLREVVVESRTTLMEVVPAVVAALLEAGIGDNPHALRAMISGGEALSWETADRWLAACPGVELYNAYGPTECADDVSIYRVTTASDRSRPVLIGAPLANMTGYILDDGMQLVPQGMAGALWVGGTGVGRGYLGNPSGTAEAFVPDPYGPPGARLYRTGDLARYTADGDLEYLGRVDRQVKMRGLRIEPGEVEAALRAVDGVREAVVKVHDTARGMSLVGHLVLSGTGEPGPLTPAEHDAFRRELAGRLPRHMIPTVLLRSAAIPRFGNGKINYGALEYRPVESTVGPGETESAAPEPSDPVTVAVRAIWTDLLGGEQPALQDNFFLLGGHSLLALRMIDRVGQEMSVELEIDSVFDRPTLGEFVEAVRGAKARTRSVTPLRRISREPVRKRENT